MVIFSLQKSLQAKGREAKFIPFRILNMESILWISNDIFSRQAKFQLSTIYYQTEIIQILNKLKSQKACPGQKILKVVGMAKSNTKSKIFQIL